MQGTNDSSTNEYWNWISHNFLAKPSEQDIACHYPKPILLFTGGLKWPADWTQGILPLQIFQLGNFYIVGLPAEFNTMAGRRLRETVYATLAQYGVKNATVVLSCLCNAYSHYVSTPSEYRTYLINSSAKLELTFPYPVYRSYSTIRRGIYFVRTIHVTSLPAGNRETYCTISTRKTRPSRSQAG